MGASVGLLHPGAMGEAMGAALVGNGHEVLWASTGRSDATRARAAGAALTDVVTLDALAARSNVVISICPPEHAARVGRDVRDAGFDGLFVDANTIAPETVKQIAPTVDGGVIGPPPRTRGTTRLYLSGPRAGEVQQLFDGSALDRACPRRPDRHRVRTQDDVRGLHEGNCGLVARTARDLAANGVDDYLLAEWAISQPDLPAISDFAAVSSAPKAWRWIAEMEEIAATFAAAGQPDGFHRAAAAVYRQVAGR